MTAKTATSTRKPRTAAEAAKKARPIAAKGAKAKPAPAAKKQDGQHRAAVVEELRGLGWQGPVSYTATALREVVLPWVKAGSPADAEGIPAGAMQHAHPAPKKVREPRRSKAYAAGYQQALADVAALDSLKAIREYVAANLKAAEDAA